MLCGVYYLYRKEGHGMKITDVQIRKTAAEGKLKAYATVTFDDCFVLHPITPEFRSALQENVLFAYDRCADD